MLDTIFDGAGAVLAFFYGIVPNYAIAIMLMTILVMVVTAPLTLKGTRSMIRLQLLQPELKRIQTEHKADKAKQQEEMMRFYQENQVNPFGGCFPLLVQMPVFLLLFNVIRGLTRTGEDGLFDPKYLDTGSELYRALHQQVEMLSFGLDLSRSALQVLQDDVIKGIPYLILVLVQIGGQYLQQQQVQARNKDGSAASVPGQQAILRFMPVIFGVFSLNFPAALVIYWVTSSLWRIGLQAYITRSLYGGDDSLGAQAQRASAEARKTGKDGKDGAPAKSGAKSTPKANGAKDKNATPAVAKPVTSSRVTPAGGGRQHPSSKKKKKRKR